jgi:plasminogen activator
MKRYSVSALTWVFLSGVLCLQAMGQNSGLAADRSFEVSEQNRGIELSFRMQAGYLMGEANEFVYDGGRTLSQLIWEINSLYMVGSGTTLKPCRWVSFQGDFLTMLADGDGTMDDYDWVYSGMEWSDWSHHEDTDVTKGTIIDVSVAVYPLQMLEKQQLSISALLGYRIENFEWEARGGTFVYSGNGFRDTTGAFTDYGYAEDQLGITYEQLIYVPYVGVNLSYRLKDVEGGLRLIGSPFVSGEADDQHHLRDLETHAEWDGGSMFSVSGSIAYHIGDYVTLSTALNYTEYDTVTMDSTYTWTLSDGSEHEVVYEDTEGANLQTMVASMSVSLNF